MIIFQPKSLFLQSISRELCLQGCEPEGATWVNGFESMSIPWFPELKNGLLILDDEEGWIQDEGPDEPDDDIMMLHFRSDGRLKISTGEGAKLFETTIAAAHELNEILEFYVKTRIDRVDLSARKSSRLNQWVEEVFLLIPNMPDGSGVGPLAEVWPLKPNQLKADHPEVFECVNAFLTADQDAINKCGYWHFGAYLKENKFEGAFLNTVPLQAEDVILQGDGTILRGSSLLNLTESQHGSEPAVVLRMKKSVSEVWFWDYLNHASEAELLANRLAAGWQYLPKGLGNIEVVAPASKATQVADAIMRRNARQSYLETLKDAMDLREPFESMQRLYTSRKLAADILHGDFQEEIDAMRAPLPFFIEYPYRAFRREEDHLSRVKNGQRLLNILAKIPLFLVVEELLNSEDELGKEFLNQLKGKPLSDGAYVTLQKALARRVSEGEAKLVVFPELLELMGNCHTIENIVNARNRMHHEPYDEEGFLSVITEGAPKIIADIRQALTGIQFMIPKGIKVVDGKVYVEAENVASFDGFFQNQLIQAAGPVEQYETDKIVVIGEGGSSVLKMDFLLHATTKTHKTRDFGIFDRMKASGPEYTFLRS